MTPTEKYNEKTAERVIAAFKKRGIEGYYCSDKEEALKKAIELIPVKSTVTWGGSQSIAEIGLCDALKKGDYKVYDRAEAKSLEETMEIYRKAFSCNFYLGSANAATLDGKLVNIDGNGNRVAAMTFGPDNVLLIIGINKLCENEEAAVKRAKNKAAVINALRLGGKTVCCETGFCAECLNDNCICAVTAITRKSKPAGRIKVILVGEEVGY